MTERLSTGNMQTSGRADMRHGYRQPMSTNRDLGQISFCLHDAACCVLCLLPLPLQPRSRRWLLANTLASGQLNMACPGSAVAFLAGAERVVGGGKEGLREREGQGGLSKPNVTTSTRKQPFQYIFLVNSSFMKCQRLPFKKVAGPEGQPGLPSHIIPIRHLDHPRRGPFLWFAKHWALWSSPPKGLLQSA